MVSNWFSRNQSEQVGELEGRHALGLEQRGKAGTKSLISGTWASTLLAAVRSACLPLRGQFLRQSHTEKVLDDRDALGARGSRGACGGLDTGTGDVACLDVLQQVAVIGSDLDHMAVGSQIETRDHVGHVALGMCEPAAGKAAEVGVLGIEQFVCLGKILGLCQPALLAYQNPQRKPLLRCMQCLFGEVGIGGWRTTQVHQRQFEFRTAVAALHGVIPAKFSFSSGCPASRGDRSGHRQWPLDGQPGILDIQAALGSGMVGGGMEIQHLAVVAQRLKSMCKALREHQGLVVVGAEQLGMPVQESR